MGGAIEMGHIVFSAIMFTACIIIGVSFVVFLDGIEFDGNYWRLNCILTMY